MNRLFFVLALVAGCADAPHPKPAPAPPPPAPSAKAPLDCAKEERCRTHGVCTTFQEKECMVANDADCAKSDACKKDGNCIARLGREGRTCAKSCKLDKECADSGRCKDDGAGTCEVGSDADCRASVDCKQSGACANRGAFCMPASDHDCRQSNLCKTGGFCVFRKGHRCLTPRELRCDCAPPGKPSPEGLKAHQDCLAKGGGWGPMCGPPPQ
jgi:hypothetical protein